MESIAIGMENGALRAGNFRASDLTTIGRSTGSYAFNDIVVGTGIGNLNTDAIAIGTLPEYQYSDTVTIGTFSGNLNIVDYPIIIGNESKGYPVFMCANDEVIFKLKDKEIKLLDLVHTIDNLNNKIKELEETITEMKYAPGGIEYLKAKEHFQCLANNTN